MNKQLPDIGIYLAEQALKEYYRPRRQIIQLEEIEEFCRQEASLNLYRTYLRLQRQHIDRIVVGMVLANLAEDEQKFVQYGRRRAEIRPVSLSGQYGLLPDHTQNPVFQHGPGTH